MSVLVAKEVRLLLPAWAAGLLLAFVPLWIMPPVLAIAVFAIGALMVGLSAFGREFGMKTFPLILAQPLERRSLWRTKTTVLAIAMTSIFLALWLAAAATGIKDLGHDNLMVTGSVIAMTTFAGGLWTTLLLRQVASAFWFCVLVPSVIQMIVTACGGSEMVGIASLAVYSIAAFLWARRYFFRMQEAGWTGGEISIAGWADRDSTDANSRSFRPFMALCWKEVQLHQFNLFGIGLLFLLHVGVIGLRKLTLDSSVTAARAGLHVFGGIWFIVPLLVASTSIAEERKLGTSEIHLSLPVSRRLQFLIKLGFALIVGATLSAFLLWLIESIGSAIHAGADIEFFKTPFNPNSLVVLGLIFIGLTLAGFYGSTLSRGIVQALAIGLFTAWAAGVLLGEGRWPEQIVHLYLWRGPLIWYTLAPALVAVVIWLAWRNFALLSESKVIWRRNLLGWIGTLFLVSALTAGIYHRVWELLTPIEPAHGAARLNGVNSVRLRTGDYEAIGALLPDGKLWLDKTIGEAGPIYFAFSENTGFRGRGKFVDLLDEHLVPGSNWVETIVRARETVALRSDGTLWVSDKPVTNANPYQGPRTPPTLVQHGRDHDWQNIAGGYRHWALLLKQNGTLWRWGTNDFSEKPNWPGLRAFTPVQIGRDSDWADIVNGSWSVYGWKTNGTAWWFYTVPDSMSTNTVLPGLRTQRLTPLDNARWRAFAYYENWYEVGLRDDGTLWGWLAHDPAARGKRPETPTLFQIGGDRDWVGLASHWPTMTAMKKDGTLWTWRQPFVSVHPEKAITPPRPIRVGSHSDWIAVANFNSGTLSVAADGSLWFWQLWDDPEGRYMLKPSRKPMLIGNVFH